MAQEELPQCGFSLCQECQRGIATHHSFELIADQAKALQERDCWLYDQSLANLTRNDPGSLKAELEK